MQTKTPFRKCPNATVCIYGWRKRFAGMSADDVKEMKSLTQENARLKKLLAERDLEIEVMKEIAVKKW